jgi:putative acetyltransferase
MMDPLYMQTQSIQIEQFKQEYSTQVIDLILSIQNDEFGVQITIDEQNDLKDIENFYINSGGDFLIARSGSIVIGTIALLKISNSDYAIRKMFVKKEYRGKDYKIAQQLLEQSLFALKSKSAHKVYLGTIDKYQAAIRFYSRNDFNQIDQKQLPDYFPRMKVDNIFFYKDI